jgi:hypothetical protein
MPRSSVYMVLGNADRGSMRQRWRADLARCLVGAFAIVALVACGQPQGVSHDWADAPRTTEDAHSRQIDIDVLAIVAGMASAHGGGIVAWMPAEPRQAP